MTPPHTLDHARGLLALLFPLPPVAARAVLNRAPTRDREGLLAELRATVHVAWLEERRGLVCLPADLSSWVNAEAFSLAVANRVVSGAGATDHLPSPLDGTHAQACEARSAAQHQRPLVETARQRAVLDLERAEEEAAAAGATRASVVLCLVGVLGLAAAAFVFSVAELGALAMGIARPLGWVPGAPLGALTMPELLFIALTTLAVGAVNYVGVRAILVALHRRVPAERREWLTVVGAGASITAAGVAIFILRAGAAVPDHEVTGEMADTSMLALGTLLAVACTGITVGLVLAGWQRARLWSRALELRSLLADVTTSQDAVASANAELEQLDDRITRPERLAQAYKDAYAKAEADACVAFARASLFAERSIHALDVIGAEPLPVQEAVRRLYEEGLAREPRARESRLTLASVFVLAIASSQMGCEGPAPVHAFAICDGTGVVPACVPEGLARHAYAWTEAGLLAPGSTYEIIPTAATFADTSPSLSRATPAGWGDEDPRLARTRFVRELLADVAEVEIPVDTEDPCRRRGVNRSNIAAALAITSRRIAELPPGTGSIVVMTDGWLVAPEVGIEMPRDDIPEAQDLHERLRSAGFRWDFTGAEIALCGLHNRGADPHKVEARDRMWKALLLAGGARSVEIRSSCESRGRSVPTTLLPAGSSVAAASESRRGAP